MAGDIAYLGLALDSKPAVAAANDLDKLTTAATKVEKAANDMGRGVEQASKRVQQSGRSIDGARGYMDRLIAAADKLDKQMGALGGAAARQTVQMERLEKALLENQRAFQAVATGATVASKSLAQTEAAAASAAQNIDRVHTVSTATAGSLQRVGVGIAGMGSSAQSANTNIKLTSGQVQNLGYQLNDIVTMLAMGASPFQILASQGGQVVQALGDGPGGVKGSLTAIGSSIMGFARSIPVAGYAIAGVTAAVGALWYITSGPKARSAEESVKSFQNAVKRLEDGWRGAGAAADEHFAKAQRAANGNQSTVRLDTQADLKSLRTDYRNSVRDLNTLDSLPEQILRARAGGLSAAHQEIRDLYTDLRKGEMTASAFAAKMLEIRLDPQADDFARAFAESIRRGVAPAVELEQRINAIASAAAKLGGRGGRVTGANEANPFDIRDRFGGKTETAGRLDPAGMDGLRGQLRAQRGELESYIEAAEAAKAAVANFSLSPVDKQLADTAQSYDRRIAAYKKATTDTIGLDALRAEKEAALALITKDATRAEEARRSGYALDLKAVGDVTAAQKAATAGERAYIAAIAEGNTEAFARARQDEANALSMAQARQQLAEATRQQAEQSRQQIEQAQLEFDMVGKSAGEVARLQAEYQLLAQAKAAARAAGFSEETVVLTDAMKQQAAEVGRLTEATQRLNMEREILFDRQQASRSPEDQRIAAQLRSYGIEFESAQGKATAAQLRLNERLHEANDRLYELRDAGKEAFGAMVDSIGKGGDALGAFAQAFAGLGKQMTNAGLDRLFKSVSGNASNGGGIIGVLQGLSGAGGRIAANQNVSPAGYIPSPTSRPEFAEAAAAVSGQVLTYAKRFNQGVDGRLMTILKEASANFPMRVEAISGVRSGDPRFHGKGLAADVQIYGSNGKALGNYQDASSFRVYEQFAQQAKVAQEKLFPELGKLFRWGGYFSGGKGKYGALDTMHFDLGGAGMGGGSWANGLTDAQRRYWSGAQSIGIGSSPTDTRALARGVSQGMQDFARSGSVEGYDRGQFDPGSPSNPSGGMTRGQAGLGALAGFAGLFGQGMSGGNPLMGGVSGALGGIELGGMLGTAFPSLGAAAGPLGIAAGAPIGRCGSVLNRKGSAA